MLTLPYPFNHAITLEKDTSFDIGHLIEKSQNVSADQVLQVAIVLGEKVRKIQLGIVGNSNFSIDCFFRFIQACPNCKIVDLSYCDFLTDKHLEQISKAPNARIEQICLRSLSQITEKGLKTLEEISSLKEVELQHNVKISHSPLTTFKFKVNFLEWLNYH